ncbi:MAG: DNA methyltransferase [Candidatus Nanoarchaeia archaeon]|jgi:tRNA (guanine10-N2)-dimethyltransferase
MLKMEYLFLISGENPELAKAEMELFADAKIKEHAGSSVIAEASPFENNRLAYTKVLCKYLFSCKKEELAEQVKNYAWNKVYKDNFYVHIHHEEQGQARKLADIIWNTLEKPKVSFDNPKTEIDFIFEKDKVFCGLRIYENKEKFDARKAHKRPGFSPISLHPKLARALVNMTRINKGETLLDPFCGTGGILLEAGLMKIKCIGSDIAEDMLEKAEINLKSFKIKNYKLMKADAKKIKLKCNAIATDPPYGKASSLRKQNMKKLYSDFLSNAYKILSKKSRVAIIFPNRLSIKSKFKILRKIDVPIHKSLTRTINILEK